MTLSPDGSRFFAWNGEGTHVWDVKEHNYERTLNLGPLHSFEIAPNGKFLVAVGSYFSCLEIDNDFRELWKSRGTWCATISPDSRWIIGAKSENYLPHSKSRRFARCDSRLQIIDPANRAVVYTIPIPNYCVTGIDAARDGTIVTCDYDGQLLLWEWPEIERELPPRP